MSDSPRPTIGLRGALLAVVLLALALAVVVQGRMLSEQGERIAKLEASTRRIQQQNLQMANGMNQGQQAMNRSLLTLRKDVASLKGDKAKDAGSSGSDRRSEQ